MKINLLFLVSLSFFTSFYLAAMEEQNSNAKRKRAIENPVAQNIELKKPTKNKRKKRKIAPEREKGADETQEIDLVDDDSHWGILPLEMKEHIISFLNANEQPEKKLKQLSTLSLVSRNFGNFTQPLVYAHAHAMVKKHASNAKRLFLRACAAGSIGYAKTFIDAGVDYNARDEFGRSALILAIINRHEEVALLLIDHGACTTVKDDFYLTALHYAAVNNCKAVVERIYHEVQLPEILLATMLGNNDEVERLLQSGEDLNSSDSSGITPLMIAAHNGNDELANRLTNFHPVVNQRFRAITPLEFAAVLGHKKLVEHYLTTVDFLKINKSLLNKSLDSACSNGHHDIVELLVSYGADINAHNKKGRTPLMCAVIGGNKDIVELLLNNYNSLHVGYTTLKIDDQNNFGQTALMLAIEQGYEEIACLLKKNSRSNNISDDFSLARLHYAITRKFRPIVSLLSLPELSAAVIEDNIEKVETLIKQGHSIETFRAGAITITPLMYACLTSNVDIARLLIKSGANVNAEFLGHQPLLYATHSGCEPILKLLLDNGAQSKGKVGGLALLTAASKGHDEAVALLLSRGLKADTKDQKGRTALIHAVINGHTKIVELLLAAKSTINTTDRQGFTAIGYAIYFGQTDIFKLLLSRGARVNPNVSVLTIYHAMTSGYDDIIDLLLPKVKDRTFNELFGIAIINGDLRTLKRLCANKKRSTKIFDFYDALTHCALSNQKEVAAWLLSNGVDSNVHENKGIRIFEPVCKSYGTPLIAAVLARHEDMVALLLAHGADPNLRIQDKTPLSIATDLGDKKIVDLLIAHGADRKSM